MTQNLLSPINVGKLVLKNRMTVAPMVTCYCDDDGMPSEQYIAYHEARAKGGFGLIVTEDYAVDPRGRGFWCAGLWKDSQIAPHRELTERVHAAGAAIFAQVYHCGRQTSSSIIGAQPVSASELACPVMGETPKALTIEEIETIVSQFGDTALRARQAGFDGVEVHGAHGYLIAQFMSSYSNKRTDAYGGSLRNRLRFPLEIVADIRAKCGPDFVVSFRISAREHVAGGRDLAETLAVCRALEAAGVDLLHISAGTYESAWAIVPPLGVREAWLAELGAAVKRAVSIPVQLVGRMKEPDVAEAVLAAGQADLITFGRASLADPDIARKVAEGRAEEIRSCIGCNQGCITILFENRPIRCLVNPSLGFEGAREVRPAANRRQVLVVGGGPAGLEAARAARLVGHDVTLLEREQSLGGNFRVGAVPPSKGEMTSYITWLGEELARLGVEVRLGAPATPEAVQAISPDVIVWAAGARPLRPAVRGIDGPNVVAAVDVLRGRVDVGRDVVVAGGGMIGSETAAHLATLGKRVTIVEQMSEIAEEEVASRRYFLMAHLADNQVRLLTDTRLVEVTERGVVVERDQATSELACDTVVLALGMGPEHRGLDEISDMADVRVVGDASRPSDALVASRAGFACGLSL